MTSQGSDTVTSIFKCNSYKTTTSLRLLKMAYFSLILGIFVSILHSWLCKQNGGHCDRAYGEVNELGGPVIPGIYDAYPGDSCQICKVYVFWLLYGGSGGFPPPR